MPPMRFLFARRITLALAAMLIAASAADAAAPPPAGLVGAWGNDSSCGSDVAVFRSDGTVVMPGAAPGAPVTHYTVAGPDITFTQGDRHGTFAFALNDAAVAWSNGVSLVLKARCADQSAFADLLGSSGSPTTPAQAAATAAATAETKGSLFDQVKAEAAAPLVFNGITIKVLKVTASPAASGAAAGPIYDAITAEPDPAAVGPGAKLYYRIFPTEASAAAYVSLSRASDASFIHRAERGGRFGTASATDTGPVGKKDSPVAINCLRLHPSGRDEVRISCFAHLPGTRLVAGGAQSFPLAKGAKPTDLGTKGDLSETLDLTSLAITQLRPFAGGG